MNKIIEFLILALFFGVGIGTMLYTGFALVAFHLEPDIKILELLFGTISLLFEAAGIFYSLDKYFKYILR